MAEARKRRKSDDVRRANQVIRGRTVWLMAIFGVATFLLLFWKLFDLQILRHEELESKAVSQQTRSSVVNADRGTIYDASGNILAISSTAETIFLSPKEINDALNDEKNPVTWTKGWPVMGIDRNGDLCGEPVSVYRKPKTASPVTVVNPVESDEFDSTTLGLQWQWHANYQQKFGMPTSNGFFRMYTHKLSPDFKSLWEAPNLLLQKTPADTFTATSKLTFAAKKEGQYGGIIMMGRDYSALVVRRVGNEFQLQQLTCYGADHGKTEIVKTLATFQPSAADKIDYDPAIYRTIYLRLKVSEGAKMTFAYSLDGKRYKACGDEFLMKEGKWIGAKFGFCAEEPAGKGVMGFMDIDWIRIDK